MNEGAGGEENQHTTVPALLVPRDSGEEGVLVSADLVLSRSMYVMCMCT